MILKFIEKHFGLVITSGIIVGLIFGDYMIFSSWLIAILLMVQIFVSALRANLLSFSESYKKPGWIVFLIVAKLFLLPLIVYPFLRFLPEEIQTGALILACVPAGVAGPGLLVILRGNIKVGLIVTVITNLLAPLTMPLLLLLLVGTKVEIDILSMFGFLALVVVVPIILAVLTEKYLGGFVKKINKNSGGYIGILVFIFMAAAVGPYRADILNNVEATLRALLVVFGLSIFFHILGRLFAVKAKRDMVVTSVVYMAYTNAGLGIVLAAQYFDFTTFMITLLYEIPWAVGLIPLQMIFAKKKSLEYNSAA